MERMKFLKSMTAAPGIPGFERQVQEVLLDYLDGCAAVSRDRLGSLIFRKVGDENGPKVMLPGHMDEIGFMVNLVTDEGYLRFVPLGGWWDQVLLGQRVRIQANDRWVTGVIGSKPPHILKDEERSKVVKQDAMFIDIGARNRDHVEQELGIKPGAPVFPVSEFEKMADPKMILAKAWDDRAGCAAFAEVIRALQNSDHPNVVYGVGTVQEEVGLRGAQTSAQMIEPDVCVALDVGIAGDMPGVTAEESPLKMGKGPVMYLADRSVIAHPGLRELVIDTARGENIDLQFSTLMGGGTDAGSVHLVGAGVPSLTLGVAVRYVHSHQGIMHLDDYEGLVKLLTAVVRTLDWDIVKELHK